MTEEYLKLFNNIETKNNQWDNLNETQQPQQPQQQQNQWGQSQQNQWGQSLNETPDVSQYNINENINDGWGTNKFQVETRVNGIPNPTNNLNEIQNTPYQTRNQRRRNNQSQNLNGLDQFLDDDDLNEVLVNKHTQSVNEILQHPTVDNLEDHDVITVEMFERMNTNAFLTLNNISKQKGWI